ncbi:MAG: hypothetical protein GX665_12400 [Gammaproteobacteria bacterium]|nr:hypothetical protein [Gammaproteobacteria bacterium]
MSYIIKNNQVIAKIKNKQLPSGQEVSYSGVVCEEKINASRGYNLVSAQYGKISNAKKWESAWLKQNDSRYAEEINPGEFQIS